jgi:hypothetical protein
MRFPTGLWAQLPPGQIAGIYFVASMLWPLASDQALDFWGQPTWQVIQISAQNGGVYGVPITCD